ncbi:MAG: glycosyltransferase family 4 protein [Candidatus Krumholzibacteria bacterium]|nr:glycosyltransferase family 4 protein [Candidatus Krumholzibacteria bacterium]
MHRILYVEDAPTVGGSAVCLEELVRGLDRSRFEPFVLFAYDLAARRALTTARISNATTAMIGGGKPEPVSVEEDQHGVPGYKLRGLYHLLWSIKSYACIERHRIAMLAPWIAREGFALVHANNSCTANLAALVAASRAGVPAVSHQRGFSRTTAFQRFATRSVRRFICISRSIAEHYLAEGLPRNKVITVYDGIDVQSLRPRSREKRDRAVIAWAGRLVSWKGASILVEAAERLLERGANVDFVIAGTGPELSGLREKIERTPLLRDRLRLVGFRTDVRDLIAGCDIFVNTSIEPEPFGHSALEALAFGIPVVASDCGGLPEMVQHGGNGFLFEPGDAGALAEALSKLIDDGDLRARFGIESRRRAERLFSLENHIRAIEAVYKEAIECPGTKRVERATKP